MGWNDIEEAMKISGGVEPEISDTLIAVFVIIRIEVQWIYLHAFIISSFRNHASLPK